MSDQDQARFQLLADNIREIFWIVDPREWRALYLNPAFERVTGLKAETVYKDPRAWRKALHPEDRARVEEELDRRNAAGEGHNLEYRIVRPDGEVRWLWARGLPVRDYEGDEVVVGVIEDITARKRTEQELERSVALLRATLEATADGILALDANGRVTTFNHRLAELWRIPDSVPIEANHEDALWRYILEQLQDPEAFSSQLERIGRRPEADSFDVLEFVDGRIFEAHSRPRRLGDRLDGRVWSFRDTTARTRAERELRDRNRRVTLYNETLSRLARQRVTGDADLQTAFERIAEAAADMLETERAGIWLFDADHSGIRPAEVFERGQSRHGPGERLNRDDAPAYFAALESERTVAIGDVRTDPRTADLASYYERHGIRAMLDAPVRAGDELAGIVCFEHRGPPRQWSIEERSFAGSIADLVTIAIESADRQQAEWGMRLLAEASMILSSTLDYHSTLDNVARLVVPRLADWCVLDVIERGQIQRVAARHREDEKQELLREYQLRYPPDWSSTQPAGQVFRSGRAELVPEMTDEILMARTRDEEQRRLLKALDLRSYIAVPLSARDRVLGVLTLASTSRSYDEQDFSLAQALASRAAMAIDNATLFEGAQEASRARSSFFAIVSHELRTPLTAIMGYTDLMLDGITAGPPPPGFREQLTRIRRRSDDLVRIIDEMLAFASLDTGSEQVRPELVNLAALVREMAERERPAVTEAGLEFRVRVAEEPLMLETDPTLVRQILAHLISNAVRFTRQGAVELEITLRKDLAEIRVTDTGIGIAAEDQERVFAPFFQVEDTTTREKGGTGLGLAVARLFARRLHGDVVLHSRPEKGSTFILQLPLRLAETRTAGDTPNARDGDPSAPAGARSGS